MEIELKDPKFFGKIIKMFSEKNYMTFDITSSYLRIQTTDIHTYFLNMEPKFFNTTQEIEFTVNGKYMNKFVEILVDSTLRLDSYCLTNTLKLNDSTAKISLPIISTINSEYCSINDVQTKLVIKNFKILTHLKGIVTYTLHNAGILVTSHVDEAKDEIYIYNVDLLQPGNLNFTCSNSWVHALDILGDYIESVLMCFGDNVLVVQFLFKNYDDSYFEIQVPRNFE